MLELIKDHFRRKNKIKDRASLRQLRGSLVIILNNINNFESNKNTNNREYRRLLDVEEELLVRIMNKK